MSYIAKERAMLAALKDCGFAPFKGDEERAYDWIATQLDTFPAYANTVIQQQTTLPILRAKYDGEDFRVRADKIDENRRIKHEAAIASVSMLNRMSVRLGLAPFADIDTTNRYEVADFIGRYVSEVYAEGTSTTLDDALKKHPKAYDTDHARRLKALEEVAESATAELSDELEI